MPFIEPPEPRPVFVLLCGRQGHGKTEVARYLERSHGFYRASFAESIRAMLAAAGVPVGAFARDRKDLPCEQLSGHSPRDAMESLGAWGRNIAPDFWAQAWERRVHTAGEPPQVVVDDARFDLETQYAYDAAARRGAEFVLLHVVRPGADEGTDHASNRLPRVPDGAVLETVANDSDQLTLWCRAEAVLVRRWCL